MVVTAARRAGCLADEALPEALCDAVGVGDGERGDYLAVMRAAIVSRQCPWGLRPE
jgi:hypothetical protein